jgi:predicted SnoaL-like aldol condensation-catalyzing enzyme
MVNRDNIKRTIDTLYGEVFNKGKADLLASLVSGPYIQHNPLFPNGTDPLASYLKQARAAGVPSLATLARRR